MDALRDVVELIESVKESIKKDMEQLNRLEESLIDSEYYMGCIYGFKQDYEIATQVIKSLKSFLENLNNDTIETILNSSGNWEDGVYNCEVRIHFKHEERDLEKDLIDNFDGWNRFVQMLVANTTATLNESGIDSFWSTEYNGGFSLLQ